jgi:putative flippase GtrA
MKSDKGARAIGILGSYPILRKFISFAAIGVVATGIQYVVLIALVQLLDIAPVVASAIGFVTSAVANYLLNYHLTFESQKAHIDSGIKFIVIASLGLLLNSLIMYMGIEMLRIHYLLTQLAATGIVLLWNFAGNYAWSFREERSWRL